MGALMDILYSDILRLRCAESENLWSTLKALKALAIAAGALSRPSDLRCPGTWVLDQVLMG